MGTLIDRTQLITHSAVEIQALQVEERIMLVAVRCTDSEEERDLFEYDSIEELLERAKGKYTSGMNKEGIVIRPLEPVYSRIVEGPLSMKVLNNDYLLKE